MRARRNSCLRARIVAGVYMEELAGPASAMQIRIRETLEKRETGEDDGKEQRMCDTDEVDDMPGILTRWRTMPAEYRVSGTSKVARSSLHVGHHLARLPYTASPLFCDWEPSCSRPLRRPSQARLPPVRACLEQECLAHALAAGIRNILGSHYEPRNRPPIHPARASNHGGKGPCPNMWYKHNSTSARLRPGKDRSRSLRLGARVTGTVRFQMLLTCSGSAFNTPADSANYLCRFLTIWVMRGSGCPEA